MARSLMAMELARLVVMITLGTLKRGHHRGNRGTGTLRMTIGRQTG